MTRKNAAKIASELLRQLDANRPEASTRVSCIEPHCTAELICISRHVDNLKASWLCVQHRHTPPTTAGETT